MLPPYTTDILISGIACAFALRSHCFYLAKKEEVVFYASRSSRTGREVHLMFFAYATEICDSFVSGFILCFRLTVALLSFIDPASAVAVSLHSGFIPVGLCFLSIV